MPGLHRRGSMRRMAHTLFDSFGLGALWPWRAALAAGAAALAWGLVLRLAGGRSGWAAGAAAGVGLAVGWLMVLPLLLASPRQLVERLPAPVLASLAGGAAAAVLLPAWPRLARMLLPALGLAAALGCGWWMAGTPMTRADLLRAAPVVLGVALGAGLALWGLRDAWWAAAAAAALAAGLWAGRAPAGPGVLLAVAALMAAVGALVSGAGFGIVSRITLALALTALAALPVLARGGAADWAAAAAPALALAFGPAIGSRLPGRRAGPAIGWAVAAAPAVLAAAIAASRIP